MPTVANITVDPVENNPSIKVVNLSGEVDESNLLDFQNAVNPLIEDLNNKVLIFNLSGLEFISSKAIGHFAYLYTTLSHSQRQISITNLSQDVKDIFALVGLDHIIPIHSSLEEALQSINQTVTQ